MQQHAILTVESILLTCAMLSTTHGLKQASEYLMIACSLMSH